MTHAPLSSLPALVLLALAAAAPTHAEQIALAPRQQPGDSYLLSLETTTDIDSVSGGAGEDVKLRYQAAVVVLEAGGDGRAVRERHEQVQLSYERPDDSGSLFRDGAGYEVRRDADGGVRLFAGEAADQRLDRKVETVVADLLQSQLEYSGLPALLDPGRPVEVGESWDLDPKLARRLLGDRGLRVVEFGGPATATLEREAGDEEVLVLRYRVPVAWIELKRMPPDTRAAESEAHLEGEIRLPGDSRVRSHSQTLALRMNGVVVKSGVARPFPWRLKSSEAVAERTQALGRTVVSGL